MHYFFAALKKKKKKKGGGGGMPVPANFSELKIVWAYHNTRSPFFPGLMQYVTRCPLCRDKPCRIKKTPPPYSMT